MNKKSGIGNRCRCKSHHYGDSGRVGGTLTYGCILAGMAIGVNVSLRKRKDSNLRYRCRYCSFSRLWRDPTRGDGTTDFLLSGGGEIRTHDTVSGMIVFKTIAFSLSATPPLRRKFHHRSPSKKGHETLVHLYTILSASPVYMLHSYQSNFPCIRLSTDDTILSSEPCLHYEKKAADPYQQYGRHKIDSSLRFAICIRYTYLLWSVFPACGGTPPEAVARLLPSTTRPRFHVFSCSRVPSLTKNIGFVKDSVLYCDHKMLRFPKPYA